MFHPTVIESYFCLLYECNAISTNRVTPQWRLFCCRIQPGAFYSLKNLKQLILDDNEWNIDESVSHPSIFNYCNLTTLSLSNAFGAGRVRDIGKVCLGFQVVGAFWGGQKIWVKCITRAAYFYSFSSVMQCQMVEQLGLWLYILEDAYNVFGKGWQSSY